MAKGRAVEIEAQRLNRAITWCVQPENVCTRINAAADQPGAGKAVNPGPLACSPKATLVVATIKLFDRLIVAVRLISRKCPTDGRFKCFEGRVGLLPRCCREEVDGRKLRKCLAQLAYLLGAGEGVIRIQLSRYASCARHLRSLRPS